MKNRHGFTFIEVLIAAAILAVGLLALVSVFPVGYVDVTVSGGQSKATAYAQQMLEQLKNQPFPAAFPVNGADVPVLSPGPPLVLDTAYNRTWNICLIDQCPPPPPPGLPTVAPNRLARITVTVQWGGDRPQTVALETMRAE